MLSKYSPKAIIVFSAHWETQGTILVSDNGDSNPLLYDCTPSLHPYVGLRASQLTLSSLRTVFGFPAPLYETKFESRGDNDLSEQVVTLLEEAGLSALLSSKAEASGNEVEGFRGPGFGATLLSLLLFSSEFCLFNSSVQIMASSSPSS